MNRQHPNISITILNPKALATGEASAKSEDICNRGAFSNKLPASRRKKDSDTMTMKFLLHKDKEEKGKCHRTKARVWLPFPATVPSQPHTCFSCRSFR